MVKGNQFLSPNGYHEDNTGLPISNFINISCKSANRLQQEPKTVRGFVVRA